MTADTLERAARVYGLSLREPEFQLVLNRLGLTDEPVFVALASTSLGEFMAAYPDMASHPVIVIDDEHGRVARLDFHAETIGVEVPVSRSTELGMIVDAVANLRRDVAAGILHATVHAQTREYTFAVPGSR